MKPKAFKSNATQTPESNIIHLHRVAREHQPKDQPQPPAKSHHTVVVALGGRKWKRTA